MDENTNTPEKIEEPEEIEEVEKPKFGIGSLISHPHLGRGKILAYEGNSYRILFKGGDVRLVQFTFEGMEAEKIVGDPELDIVKTAIREALQDYGWLEADIEMPSRWTGGTLILEPGKSDVKSKEIPIEIFFKKIIGVREKLRVLEQKINNHPSLTLEEKLELESYITRSYGSLTTFNVLFASKKNSFIGQAQGEAKGTVET